MMTGLSPVAGRLAELLRSWPKARVSLRDLWGLLDEVDPASRTDGGRRRALARLLDELAEAELIVLPPSRAYDRSEDPPLPQFVTVSRPSRVTEVWEIPWRPELSWVPAAELTPSQVDRMEEVNAWLARSTDELIVPTRERSLEIFGHEKTLDSLVLTDVFAPGRLTLETLRARRVVPALYTHTVGRGDVLLVVENSDTFDSVTRALADRPGRVGVVGWGAGAGFEASVLSIADFDPPITEIRYFGDLDRSGLRIPANASDLAMASGLPAVQPAVGLYAALLRVGRSRPGQPRVAEPAAEQLVRWLDPAHRESAKSLLTSGHRLAQEAVGLAYLLRYEDWQPA